MHSPALLVEVAAVHILISTCQRTNVSVILRKYTGTVSCHLFAVLKEHELRVPGETHVSPCQRPTRGTPVLSPRHLTEGISWTSLTGADMFRCTRTQPSWTMRLETPVGPENHLWSTTR